MTNLHIANTAVFLAVAGLHVIRLAYGAPVTIGSVEIALWLSILAIIVALVLSALNWRAIQSPGKAEWLKLILGLFIIDSLVDFYAWSTGLSFWGIKTGQFVWIILFDLVVIAVLYRFIKKK